MFVKKSYKCIAVWLCSIGFWCEKFRFKNLIFLFAATAEFSSGNCPHLELSKGGQVSQNVLGRIRDDFIKINLPKDSLQVKCGQKIMYAFTIWPALYSDHTLMCKKAHSAFYANVLTAEAMKCEIQFCILRHVPGKDLSICNSIY